MSEEIERYIYDYGKYKKIQDTIMYLGMGSNYNYITVSINVLLYKNTNKSYNTKWYYKEIEYLEQDSRLEVKKISRDIDVFLALEVGRSNKAFNKTNNQNLRKEFIILRNGDLEMIDITLRPYILGYMNSIKDIYIKKGDGKTYIKEDKIGRYDLRLGNSSITIRPGLYLTIDDELKPCLDMTINNQNYTLSKLNIQNILSLLNISRTICLQTYASSVLSYFGKPPIGTNSYSMTKGISNNEVILLQNNCKNVPGSQIIKK